MKVTLYMASTPNGFIARADKTTPWLEGSWKSYEAIVKAMGAMIVGASTYELMRVGEELEKIGNPSLAVLTHSEKQDDGAVMFATSPAQAIERLSARGFTQVVVGGGAQCNAAFLKAGLVDEIILDIEPILFGHGLPLFSQCALEVPLELIETKKFAANEIQLRYKVIKESL
jgi:dihydrofolate reductase